jgi:DNA-binding NarL/FixJ family response regulator
MSAGSWNLDTAAATIRVLLVDDHDLVRTAALAAGVRGYVVKGGDADELLEAVRAVAEGGRWLPARAELALRAIHPDPEA